MPKIITVTPTTYQRLADSKAFGATWANTASLNPDGTLSFPVDDEVAEALAAISPDPEAAIQITLSNIDGAHRVLKN